MKFEAGYARVSTEDQAYQVALTNQIARLRDAGCQRVYVDIESRANDAREGLTKLLADVEAGVIEKVKITRLDRITASPGLFEQLTKKLNRQGVPLIGLDEHIDIFSADGEFSAGLQIYFGKREVRTIQIRSQRGHETRRKNKRPNPSVPWGYKVVDRRYRLDTTPFLCLLEDKPEDGAEFPGRTRADLGVDVKNIFFEAGSFSKAVRIVHEKYGVLKKRNRKRSNERQSRSFVLGEEDAIDLKGNKGVRSIFQWTHDGLARWLRNPVLRGHTPYRTRKLLGTDAAGRKLFGNDEKRENWQVAYDTHPDQRIMSEEEYQEIERIAAHNAATGGYSLIHGRDHRYPISGLLVCGECGCKMKSHASKVHPDGIKKNYYRCKNSMDKACPNNQSLRSDRAEALIIKALTERAEAVAAHGEEEENLPNPPELQQLKEQLSGLTQIPGSNPAIELAKAELQTQIEQLTWKLKQQQNDRQMKQTDLAKVLSKPDFWEELTEDEKTKLFRWLVKKVVVNGKNVTVELDV